jgi:hypothetical protein
MIEPKMPNRVVTPLWIIALFVALTEAVLGISVTQTTNGIQVALTAFVIVFPLLIAGAFFLILWNKPYVFYSPTDFGHQVDVQQYVAAMQQRTTLDENKLYENLQKTIYSTLSSSEIVNTLTEAVSLKAGERAKEEVTRILASVADKTLETIREESFLTIDSAPLLGDEGEKGQIPYEQYSDVNELLNRIYFLLRPHVPPYTYGETWLLRDAKSGKIFKDIGRIWAEQQGFSVDRRSLKAIGIVPGMIIEVINPQKYPYATTKK